MANYQTRDLQMRALHNLLELDRICREHHIRYYISDGTALGAVRHKGFIPWDDDLDVVMPRPDYEVFIQHAKEWLDKPFEIVCPEHDDKYAGVFAKIIDGSTTLIERWGFNQLGGVYIDVFPIDGLPSSRLLQKLNCMRYAIIDKLIYYIHRDPFKHGHGLDSLIIRTIQKLFSHQSLHNAIRRIRVKYDYEKSQKVLDYDDGFSGIIDKTILGTPTPVEFEGCMLMGVEKWDEYLSNKYGDYMTIPPHDDQRQHNFFYLDYNLPYRDYKDTRKFVKHHE